MNLIAHEVFRPLVNQPSHALKNHQARDYAMPCVSDLRFKDFAQPFASRCLFCDITYGRLMQLEC
jgi:hypothetical protein